MPGLLRAMAPSSRCGSRAPAAPGDSFLGDKRVGERAFDAYLEIDRGDGIGRLPATPASRPHRARDSAPGLGRRTRAARPTPSSLWAEIDPIPRLQPAGTLATKAEADGRRTDRADGPGPRGRDRGAGGAVRAVPQLSADGGPDRPGPSAAGAGGAVGRGAGGAGGGGPAVPPVHRPERGGAGGLAAPAGRAEAGRPGPVPQPGQAAGGATAVPLDAPPDAAGRPGAGARRAAGCWTCWP